MGKQAIAETLRQAAHERRMEVVSAAAIACAKAVEAARLDERAEVTKLVDELFRTVEKPQGFAHCSDGETFGTKVDFFVRVRGRLEWSKAATRRIRAFLRKHGELPR